EARRAQHLGRCETHDLGDVLHGLGAEPTLLGLGQVADGHQRRARVGVQRHELAGLGHGLGAEAGHQRATSPKIGSMEEMMATASATRPPCTMVAMLCRLLNDGARMWSR